MFVGEGPVADEDRAGRTVRRAGRAAARPRSSPGDEAARAEDVYIANVIKCRPPGNRNPEPDEIALCMPFLARQIDLRAPARDRHLGTFRSTDAAGGEDADHPHARRSGTSTAAAKVMPTFHPAYLLRTPGDKRLVWADIKLVMAELGLPA